MIPLLYLRKRTIKLVTQMIEVWGDHHQKMNEMESKIYDMKSSIITLVLRLTAPKLIKQGQMSGSIWKIPGAICSRVLPETAAPPVWKGE